jgi:hypothetical protein
VGVSSLMANGERPASISSNGVMKSVLTIRNYIYLDNK